MAVGRTRAAALVGVTGHLVEVEADISGGLPAFGLVGLPDTSLAEARDRVRAAAANSGYALPLRRITVSLSPAALPKRGSGFDLAVAVAVLAAAGALPPGTAADALHLGELALDGRLRPVRGVLPAVVAAVRSGCSAVVVPAANAEEARLVPGAVVHGVRTLADVVALHGGEAGCSPQEPDGEALAAAGDESSRPGHETTGAPASAVPDLADVAGQFKARAALEVAAAGGHHLLLTGPPGAGKTMLAARLPGLLPDLDDEAALEVTTVHSVAGALGAGGGLVRRPPFEDPHHTSSAAAVLGGGSRTPRPGAASRAHRGVLLLDEAPEFDSRVLEGLRQPLEHGELVLQRSEGVARYPARFQLVLTSNPCPCGLAAGLAEPGPAGCSCVPMAVRRYASRLSGPLLDRVDLRVRVEPVSAPDVVGDEARETTAVVAARVLVARQAQLERLRGTPWRCNGEVPGAWLRGALRLPLTSTRALDAVLQGGGCSLRGYDRVLRTAWTLADLEGADRPTAHHVGRAHDLRQPGSETAA